MWIHFFHIDSSTEDLFLFFVVLKDTEKTQPTCSSYPMDINCIIHCCTSGLLRSQMFLLVLLSFARNSWALDEGTTTEDFDWAVPAPATGWKHNGVKEWMGTFKTPLTGVDLCISSVMIPLSKILPSLFLKIFCKLLSLDTSVKESQQQYETFFMAGK